MPRRRRRRIDPEVYQEIYRMVREGGFTNAAEIYRALADKFPDKAFSERTVRDIVRELLPPDPSGPWEPGPDSDPEDDARVLEIIAAVVSRRHCASWWPTQELARWIAWIRAGWPDLDPLIAFILASDYRARRANKRDTRDLDLFLAFAPWRSREAFNRFQEVYNTEGWPRPRIYLPAAPTEYGRAELTDPRNEKGDH